MTPTRDLLTLAQWLSPAFPVSGYAYSHGLEAEIAGGRVTDAESAEAWIRTVLEAGSGRTDALFLIAALAPEADAAGLADLARAYAGSAERWQETRDQGAAFAATLRAMGEAVDDHPYPVALGVASRRLDLPPATVAALFLQAFAASLGSVCVRFVPLGQAEGQRLVAALAPVAERIASMAVDDLEKMPLIEALGGAAPGADLAAMEHETLEVRLFRT